MNSSLVRLSASATSALPRWALLAVCAVYVVSGLFGRDPWKNEDAASFGVMWTLAQGSWSDWLLPHLAGKLATENGPLVYWLGAASIRLFSILPKGWVSPVDAAHFVTGVLFYTTCSLVWYGSYWLGSQHEVQPFKYAFGGEPSRTDYGRTLADGALLILLACFGLAERGHETTAEVAQFTCLAMMLYGLICALDKPLRGTIWWGMSLGLITLAGNPVLSLALFIGTIILTRVTHRIPAKMLFTAGLSLSVLIVLSWLATVHFAQVGGEEAYFSAWLKGNFHQFSSPFSKAFFRTLTYALKNLPLFTWPAWPLAAWSCYSWSKAGFARAPHISIALSLIVPLLLLIVFQSQPSNRLFILLLPLLATVATFGLPTLKREAINAIDWFALLSFTILGSFVWIVWIASQTGFPASTARNFSRLLPGFCPEFSLLRLCFALLVTVSWIVLVHWRLSRVPTVLWRSVMLSSVGTTLMWVLLMTLWLPFVNYSRTYREVAQKIAMHLPATYQCILPVRLGDAQIASFAYFGKMRFSFIENPQCDVLLRQDTPDYDAPPSSFSYHWEKVWEGRRPADRSERFRLYLRTKNTG
jgi:4-amino-4-deoxy-L-arabinose transferase-like glycosyltransferase